MKKPPAAGPGARGVRSGTAYRIRTGDLRLERAVSWASRRMRRRRPGGGRDRRRMIPRTGPRQPADRRRRPGGARLQPVRLQERPDRLGDLLVALLAERPGRSASGRRTARTRRSSHSASRSRLELGTCRSSPPPMTSRGTLGQRAPVDRHAVQHLAPRPRRTRAASGPAGAGCAARRRGSGRGGRAGASRAASPSRCTAAAVDLGDLAQLVRPGRRRAARAAARARSGRAPTIGDALGRLERQQAAHAVADHDGRRAEPLERGDHVLGVGVERERRPGRRSATRSGCAG